MDSLISETDIQVHGNEFEKRAMFIFFPIYIFKVLIAIRQLFKALDKFTKLRRLTILLLTRKRQRPAWVQQMSRTQKNLKNH